MISKYLKMVVVGMLLSSGVAEAHDWGNRWGGQRDERHSLNRLHEACEDGNRRACVKFGMEIDERREQRQEQRQTYPQYDRWGYPTTPTQQTYPQYDMWGYPKH